MSESKPIAAAIQATLKKMSKSADETLIGIAGLPSKEQVKLLSLLEKTRATSEGMQQVEVPAEKKKSNRRVSAVATLVKRIREALIEYNRNDEQLYDIQVNLSFILESFKTDFTKEDDTNIIKALKTYETEAAKNNFISLLICFAKGKLFLEFKQKHMGQFKQKVRELLEYPYETARRYIEFARVVVKFNRLLICKQTYTELSAYLKDIENHAEADTEFGGLLKLPLHDIKCGNEKLSIDDLATSLKRLAVAQVNKRIKNAPADALGEPAMDTESEHEDAAASD